MKEEIRIPVAGLVDREWYCAVFNPDYYPAIAELLGVAYPEFARSGEEIRWAASRVMAVESE